MSAPLDKPAKSVSRDALLPLPHASWSSEGTVLDDQRTGPFTHTSARYLDRVLRGHVSGNVAERLLEPRANFLFNVHK